MPADLILTPEIILKAYTAGVFPMADSATNPEIYWVDPKRRGIFELDKFHLSKSMRAFLKKGGFDVRFNTRFSQVMHACADRKETWINEEILQLYQSLHEMGHAHSVEVFRDDELIGGVYGLALGRAFFGESMFSRATNGSKIALTYLIARLRTGGFTLFDTQFITDHLASLGAIEIPREDYHTRLAQALSGSADIHKLTEELSPQGAIQRSTQTS